MARIVGLVKTTATTMGCAVLCLLAGCLAADRAGNTGPPAPVVLVSFDGFRWDYAGRTATPNFDRLAADGVHAERLIPVFPSKTYPGHYSVATGLYPGHHGIISNNMRAPGWPEVFRLSAREEVENGRWWAGEPIWVTAKRHGLKAGAYFWPGSEAPVQGVRPDWWFPYDAGIAWEGRVDAALDWLTKPESERASIAALYFEEPNDAGHTYGPDAPETMEATRRADSILGRLLDGLAARVIEANVVVVADHGMTATGGSRVIVLDDYISLLPDELFEYGALGQIFPAPGRETTIFAALDGAHPELGVYRREATPEHLHLFGNPRVAPILLMPSAGWEVMPRSAFTKDGPRINAGDHGFDPTHPDMHGIFYAAGPGIARGRTIGAVEQVDVYALLCRLLGIEPAPNDGVWERIAGAIPGK
jgi:predicted AlkP superfamily pyrophosphatase or phosphodiesterase